MYATPSREDESRPKRVSSRDTWHVSQVLVVMAGTDCTSRTVAAVIVVVGDDIVREFFNYTVL